MSLSLKKSSEISDMTDQATYVYLDTYIYAYIYHQVFKIQLIIQTFSFAALDVKNNGFFTIKVVKADDNSAPLTEIRFSKESLQFRTQINWPDCQKRLH